MKSDLQNMKQQAPQPLYKSANNDEELRADTESNTLDPRKMMQELKTYKNPRTGRSLIELAITLIPFLALSSIMLFALKSGYYWTLLLVPIAGLFLLRLFIIQHDCGHGSFLANRFGNDYIGRALGVFTFTPYDCWRRSHAQHHAATGNLDARGFGDVDTLTIREFNALSSLQKLLYRFYRHPIVLLGLGPAYLFFLRHRLPIGHMKEGYYWISAMATNAGMALILFGLIYQFGLTITAMIVFPMVLTAASVGVWLFYIQHQFENTHWDENENWSFHDAALHGSSHLDLPPVLRWFTGNIGIHHVHHLVSRIPFYRLTEVLKAHPSLKDVNRLTILKSMRTLSLALWDEQQRKMVSFREAKANVNA